MEVLTLYRSLTIYRYTFHTFFSITVNAAGLSAKYVFVYVKSGFLSKAFRPFPSLYIFL